MVAAVSGGADSLALLHLLWRMGEDFELGFRVVSVDHGLRGERGATDVEHVRAVSADLGLPFQAERADVAALIARGRVSPEDAARRARYAILAALAREWGPGPAGAPRVATGHTLDDQAETVLMRIIEGTGLDGLAGMAPLRQEAGWTLVRPLLETSRREVMEYCSTWGLRPVDDETNQDPRFRRNRIRLDIMPALAAVNPRVTHALAGLAELAREDEAVLDALASRHFRRLASGDIPAGEGPFRGLDGAAGVLRLPRRPFLRLAPAVAGRVIRQAIQHLGGRDLYREIGREGIKAVLTGLRQLRVGGRLQLAGGILVEQGYDDLFFTRAAGPAREAADGVRSVRPAEATPLCIPGRTDVPESGWVFEAQFVGPDVADAGTPEEPAVHWPEPASSGVYRLSLPTDLVKTGGLAVRTRRPGDVLRPAGLGGTKKLKDLFISAKVPRSERDRWPLLVDSDDRILWVVGLRVDERAAGDPAGGWSLLVTAWRRR